MLFLKWFKNSIENKLKKNNNKMMQDETEKKNLKKNQVSLRKPHKPELMSQPYNPLNPRPRA